MTTNHAQAPPICACFVKSKACTLRGGACSGRVDDILYFAGDLSKVEAMGHRYGLQLVTSETEDAIGRCCSGVRAGPRNVCRQGCRTHLQGGAATVCKGLPDCSAGKGATVVVDG